MRFIVKFFDHGHIDDSATIMTTLYSLLCALYLQMILMQPFMISMWAHHGSVCGWCWSTFLCSCHFTCNPLQSRPISPPHMCVSVASSISSLLHVLDWKAFEWMNHLVYGSIPWALHCSAMLSFAPSYYLRLSHLWRSILKPLPLKKVAYRRSCVFSHQWWLCYLSLVLLASGGIIFAQNVCYCSAPAATSSLSSRTAKRWICFAHHLIPAREIVWSSCWSDWQGPSQWNTDYENNVK